MSKLLIFVSATIVLILSFGETYAAPADVPPSVGKAQEDAQAEAAIAVPLDDNLSIAKPQPVPGSNRAKPEARYYPYRQALTFRAGQSDEQLVLGFQYLFPKFLSPKLEAGADLHEENRGHLHIGWRYFKWEKNYFRPSLKVSLDHLANSEEQLATITTLENYYLRMSATLEYVVWNPLSLRAEYEFLAGLDDSASVVTVGLSRGW